MKYILLVFCLLTFLKPKAQTNGSIAIKKEILSPSELQRAKDLYVKMMQSEIYILTRQEIREFNENLNGVNIGPSPEEIKIMAKEKQPGKALDSLHRKRLESYLSKTKYKSVEEGMKGLEKLKELERKKQEENQELFTLLKRASSAQIGEILEPEKAMRSGM